jgi:AraC family transcriptional regulator of adaptative response / DNA-3-methyladenine glycosylase II
MSELGTGDLFPTATVLAAHGRDVLRGPAARVNSIVAIAQSLANGDVSLDLALPAAEFTRRLEALPGIGPWTAGYLSMRVLGNPDVLLATDLVLQQSAAALRLPSTPRLLTKRAASWAPWRSYAGLHLWRARPGREVRTIDA